MTDRESWDIVCSNELLLLVKIIIIEVMILNENDEPMNSIN